MDRLKLEELQEAAEEGSVAVQTESGEFVPYDSVVHCDAVCGLMFDSEESYRAHCPELCATADRRTRQEIARAEVTPVFTLYFCHDTHGKLLYVTDDLDTLRDLWWWRNVSAVAVSHFASEEDLEESREQSILNLRPLYNVDPQAQTEVAPLSRRIAPPKGSYSELVAFRTSVEQEVEIESAAEEAGLSKAEWLRRAVALYAQR